MIADLDVLELGSYKYGHPYTEVRKLQISRRYEERLDNFRFYPLVVNVKSLEPDLPYVALGELFRDGPLDTEPQYDLGWAEGQLRPGCFATLRFLFYLWKQHRKQKTDKSHKNSN